VEEGKIIMAKKYSIIRLPMEGKEGFGRKQNMIATMIRNLTNKPNVKAPPMTEVLRFYAQRPVYVYEDEVASFFLKNKRKPKGRSVFV
jgi:hypothetical protein